MNTMSQNHYAEFAAEADRRAMERLDIHHLLPIETETNHPVRYGIGHMLIRFGEWLAPPNLEPAPRVSTSHPG